jgi:hypothetical protein
MIPMAGKMLRAVVAFVKFASGLTAFLVARYIR